MILAIDVGATWTRVELIDESGRVARREKFRTDASPVETAARLAEGWSFDAVGVGSIGPIDIRRGWAAAAPNAPSRSFPLVDPLRRFGKPIYVANDTVAAAWGEYVFGGWGVDNLAYLTISTGVGVGAVVNGCLLMGKAGNAHELGHLPLKFDADFRCGCGGAGHWEAFAGGANIPRYFKALAEARGLKAPEVKSAEDVFKLYREGDKAATIFVESWLSVNAAGIAAISVAYDPEVLVIGGSIALNHWDLIEAAADLAKRYLPGGVDLPAVEKAKFGDDEVAVGAAALAVRPPESLRKFGYPR